MIFLFVGAGLEWLYRQYTNPLKLRVELNPVTTVRQRVTAGALRALITVGGLAIFALGSIGAFAAFSWPPMLETLVLNLLVVIFTVRAIRTLLVLFLAPNVQELRLLPFGNRLARHLSLTVLGLTGLYVLSASLSDIYARLTMQSVHALAFSVALATVCLVASYAVLFYSFRRVAAMNGQTMTRRARLWRVDLLVVLTLAYLALVLDRPALMWTIVLLGLLVPGLVLLRDWVDGAFDRAKAEAMALEPADDSIPDDAETDADLSEYGDDLPQSPPQHPYESYRPLAQRIVRFISIFAVGIALALIWDLRLFERAAAPTFSGRLVRVLIDSAVALLIADLIWVWARSAIDRRMDAYVPPEPGTAPGPEARMATLLPLLRVTLMVTLLAMVTMSILSSMGVNIAPILAGAGVVGIAIGFGAQSLVKDVVSGIFFLIDDAFRVGEYVEIDQLRGTVERISIRSLQLRHHRGAIHTLPYGELRHLTNHSRDWVIMKLEFRVPFDTDLKLVKKLVKKVGEQLKANEFYGDGIIQTLKSQGVRRMEEFNMVVAVKFMTKPGEQWLVRRDAYMLVRDAFEANGIRMAERNVKVEVANVEDMTPEERAAVAGAAQQAAEAQAGPPKPIPDEP
ncbi:mechanosensitive ion channel family protein [Sulfitobacter aestuariivivens]